MKNKRRLLACLLLATLASATTMAAASCGTTDNSSSSVQTVVNKTGVYYCDVAGEECILALNGNRFTLSFAGEFNGALSEGDAGNILLTFSDQTTAQVVLTENEASLEYKDATYRFLRKITYTVSYNVNGGSEVASSTVVNGRTLLKPQDPTKAGEQFIGWYKDADFSTQFFFDADVITDNTTLYARFVAVEEGQTEFTVNYALEDGSASEIASVKTVGGVVYNLPVLQEEGKTFLGWWMSDYEDVNKLTGQYTGQKLSENTTLYAVWAGDGVAVSVNSTVISWTAKGVNASYTVSIIDPNGKSEGGRTGTTSYEYDFSNKVQGDYTISITVDGNITTAYYSNKKLDRVSSFKVIDNNVLLFNAVENAEKYLITIDCGNWKHDHEAYDNGNSVYYNFSNCEMQEGGIKFTIQAVAKGYVSSTSETFTYDRSLKKVTGLAVDEDTDKVVWNQVENATSYVVEILSGENTYTFNVGAKTNFSLKEYTGEMTVKVYGKTKGYNTAEAAEIIYHKTKLASPSDVTVIGTTVSWGEVEGATKYNVKIGSAAAFEVVGTSFDFSSEADYFVIGQSGYTISVQAVADSAENNSLYSDATLIHYRAMSALSYSEGKVAWAPVVDAQGYKIKVNDENAIEVENGVSQWDIVFTESGWNTISMCYINADGYESEWKEITVLVRAIYFDARGGVAVATAYKAFGDPITLPEAKYTGFVFNGWYNVPGGAENNGLQYTDSVFEENGDIVLFAYWTSTIVSVNLDIDGMGTVSVESTQVEFKKKYTLPVAVNDTTNTAKVFSGWYSERNAAGTRYTDQNGKSIGVWNDISERTLYAGWLDVFEYTSINNGSEYSISKGAGIDLVSNVKIPSIYNEKPITTVEYEAFINCSSLVSVDIPDTIKSFQDRAFTGCLKLSAINIYEVEGNNEKIYESYDGVLIYNDPNTNIKQIEICPVGKTGAYTIPNGVQAIKKEAFKSSKITDISIPASVQTIGDNAFDSSKIINITFIAPAADETVENLSIGAKAFQSCSALKSIILPARASVVPLDAFNYCSALANIGVENGNVNYSSVNGFLCNVTGTEILYCPRGIIGKIIIPDGITTIGEGAFAGNIKITEVVISGAVQEIKQNAFKGCSSLATLTFLGDEYDTALAIRQSAFYSCTSLTELVLPANLKVLEINAFGDTKALRKVQLDCVDRADVVGDEISFANDAFASTSSSASSSGTFYIVELVIGKFVSNFEISGVFGNTTLQTVVVDPNNEYYTVDNNVVYNKDKTKLVYYPKSLAGSYVIPDSVKEIGKAVFKNKTNMGSITISKNVELIGEEAFYNCSGLLRVIFADGGTANLTIGANAFRSCSSLTEINLPDRLVKIGERAFYSAYKLPSIVIPENVTEIGDYAFSSTGIRAIHIPKGVVKMGEYDGNGNLQAINVFESCTSLTSITVDPENLSFVAYDGILYIKENGVASQLCYCPQKLGGEIVIPATVKTIWKKAFYSNDNITQITFEKGTDTTAVSIGEAAFNYCESLKKVVLPEGLQNISASMFLNCWYLEEVVIPNTVTLIEKSAFKSCTRLKTVTFEEGGTDTLAIEKGAATTGAFVGCNALESIVFPDRMASIGAYSFYNCISLKNVVIPAAIREIETYTFYGCTNLSDVQFKTDEDGLSQLTKISSSAFYYANLREIILPEGLETIDKYAFAGTSSKRTALTALSIPASVKIIGDYAFYNHKNLATVNFEANSQLENISSNAFGCCSSLTSISIPASVKTIGSTAFNYCTALTSVIFEENTDAETGEKTSSLTKIDTNAFAYTKITSIIFPTTANNGTITLPTGSLFKGCRYLTSIHLSKSITAIGGLFQGFSSINSITVAEDNVNFKVDENYPILFNKPADDTESLVIRCVFGTLPENYAIPEGVSEIAASTFVGQTLLKKITIPESVVTIGNSAFQNCSALEEIEFAGVSRLATMGSNVFQYCVSLTSFTMPTEIKELGNYLFDGCSSLSNIVFSSDITKVGNYVFRGCGFTTINLPKISTVGTYMFTNCTKLTNVNFNEGQTVLGNYMFSGCTALTTINLPTNWDGKSTNLFQNSGLTTITIPTNVKSIGNYLFDGCASLTEVNLSKVETIGNNAFSNSGIVSITLPDTVTTIGQSAFTKTKIQSITLPSKITKLGTSVSSNGSIFAACTELTEVIIEGKLTFIGAYTFSSCSKLEAISAPDAITIGDNAFASCSSLSDVNLPKAESFGNKAFFGCTSLVELDLPAAKNFNRINTGTETASKFKTPVYTFSGCTALESISLPKVEVLGGYMFGACVSYNLKYDACTSLKSVKLNDNLTYLGDYMFNGCTSLRTIQLPSALQYTGDYTFQNSGLESITIPDSVIYLGNKYATFAGNSSSYLFDGCANLESVKLSSNLTMIGAYSFRGCVSLKRIDLPNTLEILGNYSFQNSGITSIVIPAKITSLGHAAGYGSVFSGCKNLTSVIINGDLTLIGAYTFFNCSSLKEFVIPSTVQQLGSSAFAGSGIEKFIIPAELTLISEVNPFRSCFSCTSIEVEEGNTTFTSKDGVLYDANGTLICFPTAKTVEDGVYTVTSQVESYAFEGNITITKLIIDGNAVNAIVSSNTFDGMRALEEVEIGEGFEELGNNELGASKGEASEIFIDCENLQSVKLPSTLKTIGRRAFQDTPNLTELEIPKNVTLIGYGAFMGSGLTEMTIPAGVVLTSNTNNLFSDNTSIKKVVFEEGITMIPGYCFEDSSVEEVVIPSTVTEIGSSAFKNSCITKMTIPATVQTIGYSAFQGSALTEVTIENADTILSSSLFSDCSQLTTVNLPDGLTQLPESIFKNCTSLTNIKLPAALTAIPKYAFQNSGLTSIQFSDKIVSLGAYAFQNTAIRTISLPATITEYPEYSSKNGAFMDCAMLEEVSIAEGTVEFGKYLFQNCVNLTTVNLPSTLLTIQSYAFAGCEKLNNVIIPEAVEIIYEHAFEGCVEISSLIIPDGVVVINAYAFASWTENQTLYIRCSEKDANNAWAFNWKGFGALEGCMNIIWEYKEN